MLYFFIFLLGIIATENIGGSKLFENKRNFKYPYIIAFVFLFLFMGLRDKTIEADNITYVSKFLNGDYGEWAGLSEYFLDAEKFHEPLYNIYFYFIDLITDNYTVFTFFTAFPICLGITALLKQESDDYVITFIVFFTLGIISFCMAGLRQAIALGVCFLSYKYVKERRLLPFLIFVLIAYLFHNSAVVFLLAYPLYSLRSSWAYFAFVVIFFFLGLLRSPIISEIGISLAGETYESYFLEEDTGLKLTMYVIQLGMTVFCFCYKKKLCEKDKSANFLFNMSILGLCVQSLASTVSEMFRLSMYFSAFLGPLVSKAIAVEEDDVIRWLEYFLIVAVCIYYMIFLNGFILTYIPYWGGTGILNG